MDAAVVLAELGRGDELAAATAEAPATRWLEAATAYVAGDLERAADLCDSIGAMPEAAYARVEAARAALTGGRRLDAEDQLNRALGFYWRVDATAFCFRAEALLPVKTVLGP